jgi:hypothetical protein
MKVKTWIWVILCVVLGCDTEPNKGESNNTDTETDSDPGGDGDTNTDTDADADDSAVLCHPGEVVSCSCPGSDKQGIRQCAADGESWQACLCNPGTADTNMDRDMNCIAKDHSTLCDQVAADGVIMLNDNKNYSYVNTFNVTSIVVQGSTPDVVFDWSGVTVDTRGRTVNPAQDIDIFLLSLWNMSPQKLAERISKDTLDIQSNKGVFWVQNDGAATQALLTDFGPYAEPLQWETFSVSGEGLSKYFTDGPGYDPAEWTHMAMAQTGLELGKNVRMIGFFTIDSNSPNTQFNMTSNSMDLEYTIDVNCQEWIPVAIGKADLTVNWENMNFNMMGEEFVYNRISKVVIAHYPMDSCQFQDDFINLESSANRWYEKMLTQVSTTTSLSGLVEKNTATPFTGIDNTGTWVLALICDSCANPAPWFLTVLYPCG